MVILQASLGSLPCNNPSTLVTSGRCPWCNFSRNIALTRNLPLDQMALFNLTSYMIKRTYLEGHKHRVARWELEHLLKTHQASVSLEHHVPYSLLCFKRRLSSKWFMLFWISPLCLLCTNSTKQATFVIEWDWQKLEFSLY
jgi:hypothetical protein